MISPSDAGAVVDSSYPESWEADVVLRDGNTVRVRPIREDDAAAIARFHDRQSAESIYFRFFSPRPKLSKSEIKYFTCLDHRNRVAFVAVLEAEIVAVARYERYQGTDTAEVAFFVDDQHHGRGLATVLLEYLAAAGRHRGVRWFTATTLPNNRRMLDVFAAAGFDVSSKIDDGVVSVSFAIAETDESAAAVNRRGRQADAASVDRLLSPTSVAVVGTGTTGGLGDTILGSIQRGGYTGELWNVGNPTDGTSGGARFAERVPEGTDLVVIAVPADQVPTLVGECGEAGVRAVVILSAGFAEAGAAGAVLQRAVIEAARRHGTRVLGPNCMGLINNDPQVSLHAIVSPASPPPGPCGVLAESGTLSAALLELAESVALGVSSFVAAGNRADVGPADLLSFWAEDTQSAAVLLYLRASALPTRFVSAARDASLSKPVAVVGDTFLTGDDGRAATRRRVEALSRQTGLISVDSPEQLVDLGRILCDQPLPKGSGVVVVGNSEGAVAVAADACRGAGLDLVPISGSDPMPWSNPVNLGYTASAHEYREVLGAMVDHPRVHSVIVVHAPPRLGRDVAVEDVIVTASAHSPEITFAATVLSASGIHNLERDGHRVPLFRFPEHGAVMIAKLAKYRSWRTSALTRGRRSPTVANLDLVRSVVRRALERQISDASVELDLDEQQELLDAFAVPIAERIIVSDEDAAARAAVELGWPVALKGRSRDRSRRSAASGVAIDLAEESDLRATWVRMHEAWGERMFPAAVQRFIERGVDASVRLQRSDSGTVSIEVGLGGPVTALDEAQLGLLPLTLADAQGLVGSSALGRALTDPLDRVALVGVVHRLAELVECVEEIELLEADPVVASVAGAWVTDVRLMVRPVVEDLEVRRLD